MGLAENAAENIQGKEQFPKFRLLQIEEGKHVYYIYTFVTLTVSNRSSISMCIFLYIQLLIVLFSSFDP